MKNFVKVVPIPLAGVSLAFAALGNLLMAIFTAPPFGIVNPTIAKVLYFTCGAIAIILFLLLTVKIAIFFPLWKEDMKNPVMASVFGTYSMALMLISTYIKPYVGAFAEIVWYLAIIMHLALMVYFTMKFIIKFDIKKVFASYFIVYVGIAVASITAETFEKQSTIGTYMFWLGFATEIALLFPIVYRYIKHKEITLTLQPLFAILTAPFSLCLAGYVTSVTPKSYIFLIIQLVISLALYVVVLINLPKLLKVPFAPSYAAFTFPFVISAIATLKSMVAVSATGLNHPMMWLKWVIIVQAVLAVILVIYTLAKFIIYFLEKVKMMSVATIHP